MQIYKTQVILDALNERFKEYAANTQKKFERISTFTESDFKNAGGAENVIAQFVADAKSFTVDINEFAAPYVLELICQRWQRKKRIAESPAEFTK